KGQPGGDGYESMIRRYGSAGAPLSGEVQANTYTTGNQSYGWVDSAQDGSFVVVWQGPGAGDPNGGIVGQRYDSQGMVLGGEFQVNTLTTSYQRGPDIHVQTDGSFAIVWSSAAHSFGGDDIALQLFDSNGIAVGAELQVNTYTTGFQGYPKVGANDRGQFVV